LHRRGRETQRERKTPGSRERGPILGEKGKMNYLCSSPGWVTGLARAVYKARKAFGKAEEYEYFISMNKQEEERYEPMAYWLA